MSHEEWRGTRRTLLARGAFGAGAVIAGAPLARALAATASASPPVPVWRSRPDLKIAALQVTHSAAGAASDPIFIAPYNAPHEAQAGAVITSASGEPIWENPTPDMVTTNFLVQQYRGSPVLTWWQGKIVDGHGVGEYVIADSSYSTVRTVQAGNGLAGDLHEFVITPQGTALYTSYESRRLDLSSVGGPREGTIQDSIFQEQDLASGRILLEWRALEHVPIEDSYWPAGPEWDYFHINSVDLDSDGNLLVSSRNMQAVYKVDRRSGAIIWRLGGRHSDFEMGPGSRFFWQHDVRKRGDGMLTLLDNGASPVMEPRSRALILELHEGARSARLVDQYTHPGVLAKSQGSVQLLPNGNVFVGWGEIPRVSEYLRSGELVFDAVLGSRYQCYRAFRLPWSATPAQAPALAVTPGSSGTVNAYASWNGATDLAAWRLLGGASPEALKALASARSSGFETMLTAPAASGPYFAAEALDARGRALGRSAAMSA